jgi:hypothetical protein
MQLRTSLATTLAAAGLLAISSVAFAQDSTTSTTTRTTETAPGIVVGVPGIVGVQVGGGHQDCATKRTTRTDEGSGDSQTTVRSNCD